MNIWKVLGIEPTKDKILLKSAYRDKLAHTNPEDDPEGFMELRKAYEEAVRQSEVTEETVTSDLSDTPILREIKELYFDYSRRINVEEWRKLLSREEFISLDTGENCLYELIRFLMSNFYLPKDVWQLIVENFDIVYRRKELAEKFPDEFLGYMINNTKYDDVFAYQYLEGELDGRGKEIDEYIGCYYQLDIAIRRRNSEEAKKLYEDLSAMNISHPYRKIAFIKMKIQEYNLRAIQKAKEEDIIEDILYGDFQAELTDLLEDAKMLSEDYPEDIYILVCCGDIELILKNYEESLKYYEEARKYSKDSYMVKGKMAELYLYLGEYQKSRDLCLDLLKINHYDNNIRSTMVRANLKLIDEYKSKLDEESDKKIYMEMGWSYYQSYMFREALDILGAFSPDSVSSVCEYNNLRGRCLLCVGEFDEALECFFKWRDTILEIDGDGEEERKLKKRFYYINFLIGDCYLKKKQYDKSEEYLDIAMSEEHEEIVLSYEAKCELLYNMEKYGECVTTCERLIGLDENSFMAYSFMSKSYLCMNMFREALDAAEKAIAIYPYIFEPYETEIKVYLYVNQLENAKAIAERYEGFGIKSDSLRLSKARILRAEKKYEEALALIDEILAKKDEAECDIDEQEKVYELKGELCEMLGETEEAVRAYEQVIQLDYRNRLAYGRLADINKSEGNIEKAVNLYTRQLEISEYPYYYIQRGISYRIIGRQDEAIADFEKALSMEPYDVMCHIQLGILYERKNKFTLAQDYYTKGMDIASKNPEKYRKDRNRLLILLARVYQVQNMFVESEECYNTYIDEVGLDPYVAYDYSELLMRMGHIREASDILEKCIQNCEYNESVQACIRQLCEIFGVNGYVSKAYECFGLATRKNNTDYKACYIMANAFRRNGVFEEAKKLYQKVIELDEKYSYKHYDDLMEVLLRVKKSSRPSKEMKEIYAKLQEKMKPEAPIDYICLGRAERMLKNFEKAKHYLEKALKEPRCPGCYYGTCHEALYELGLLYESCSDYEMALKYFILAQKTFGKHPEYQKKIEELKEK